MFKKYLSFILVLAMLMSMSVTAFAASPNKTESEYNQYIELVNQGILAEDITFEYWKQLKETSYELEKALEASDG